MTKCKKCGKDNTNGTKFCTRKCRTEWKAIYDAKYKKYMKKNGKDLLLASGITGRGVFDYEGND